MYCGQAKVPVLKPLGLFERKKLLVFRFKARIKHCGRYEVKESAEAGIVQLDASGKVQVEVEAGEGVGRRTDDHGGELHLSDGQRVNGGGYWTALPGGEIPVNQDDGS